MDPADKKRQSWEKQERLFTRMGSRPLGCNSSGLHLCLLFLLLLGSEVLGRHVGDVGAGDAALEREVQAVRSKAVGQLKVARRRRGDAVHTVDFKWNYDKSPKSASGVYSWAKHFPSCGGSSQSPIDLLTSITTYDPSLERFTFQGFDTDQGDVWNITNNGHTVQADCTSCSNLQVSNGSLGATFQVKQFHWHWGSCDLRGSEHTVNSKAYPMEIHIVFVNTKYTDMKTILSKPDGLAVLGFLYEISDSQTNSAIQNIVNVLPSVKEPGTSVTLKVALKDLMGPTDRYYRYKGSLTTPFCFEVVTWTVFKDPIPVSPSQMIAFRRMVDSHEHSMADNFRPVQHLHGRLLKANFRANEAQLGKAISVANISAPNVGVIYLFVLLTLFTF